MLSTRLLCNILDYMFGTLLGNIFTSVLAFDSMIRFFLYLLFLDLMIGDAR